MSLPGFNSNASDHVKNFQKNYHSNIIGEVDGAIKSNQVVVVGMKYNPHCSKAVKELTNRGIVHKYIEYGSYFSMWSERLSLKMFYQWPTYPMVFVNGSLIGGCDDMVKELNEGTLFNGLKTDNSK